LKKILEPVDTWNCVLYVIDGETVLKLLSPVNIESLEEVWEWAKDNVNVEGVQSYLVEMTERNRKYNIPEKMMLKMDTGEWQYFLIKRETKFSMAEIKLEEVPREWGGFKLWRIPQENVMISIEVVAALEVEEGDEITKDVVAYQVMSYLEKTRINNVKDVLIKTCMNGENYKKPYRITTPEELMGTRKCWVDYYKKRWVLVKQKNNEMTWARIDWRNEKYYVSVVKKVINQFKFIIQNQEIKRPDQPKDQLPLNNINSIIDEMVDKAYWRIYHQLGMIEVKLTKAEHEKEEILEILWKYVSQRFSEENNVNKLKIIRIDGTPLYFQLQKDLSFETAKFDVFLMKIPQIDWDLTLIVTRVNKPVEVNVVSMKQVEGTDNQGMKMEDRMKNAVQTYMRQEQGEYREMEIRMKINDNVTFTFVSSKEPILVAEMAAINDSCDTVNSERRVSKSNLIIVTSDNFNQNSKGPVTRMLEPDRNQNDYRPKCIFMLLEMTFLLAIVAASVFFYCKKEQMLNDEILSWYIFSSFAIITIGSMVYDYLFTETMNKTWTMLAHLSLLLGLFLLSLMYISYWPISTYGIYLPFFIAPVFFTFHDTSAIPPYIKKLSEITGLDGAEYYLPFVLIYRMALIIVVLLMASKLEDEFNARWWTILIIFGIAHSIYLILVWYSLWNYKIPNPNNNDNSLHSPQYIRVYTLLSILSHIAFMLFGMFVSLMLDEILD
jgi:hypothetical protein